MNKHPNKIDWRGLSYNPSRWAYKLLNEINQDYAAFPMVALAGVVVTFLVILAIRLVFELAVAIIHIAENTKAGLRK